MSNIYVYPSGYVDGVLLDDSNTDFGTAGLVGALSPTSCIFRETENGERSLEIEHPLDSEGRYKALVKGYILSVSVPVMTVPATGDIPIEITWNGTLSDYPANPSQGFAFYLHTEDESSIDTNYYYAGSIFRAWYYSTKKTYFTMDVNPSVGDTVYALDDANMASIYGTVSTVNTNSIKIKPNKGTDSSTYNRNATYDREINGMWYRFGTDGSPIVWKGEHADDPANPQENWAYKNTEDGFTYYYANSDWVRLCDNSKMGYVYKYRLKSTTSSDKKLRTVYKKKKSGGTLKVLNAGDEVYVIEKDEKEDKRWKVRTQKYGEGYMSPEGLELLPDGTYDIRDNWKKIQNVISPWTVMTQLFRIYKVNKTIDSVKVEARDVSYDCLNNVYASSYEGTITLDQLLKNMKNESMGAIVDKQADTAIKSGYGQINFLTPDGYLIDSVTKNEYKGKTLVEVMVNESNGICSKFNVIKVVDNYNIYFMIDPQINRGFTVQYGKNMTGVEYEINDDEIVTAIIPVGKNKKGDPLYLGPSKSKDDKKNYIGWSGNIIWSVNKDKYPTKRFYILDCDVQAKGNDETKIGNAMDQMRYMAESKIHAADKQTNSPDGNMDEPKITVTIDFINLGDTEEYKQYKNLEKCFLHDYVTIRHPDLGIDITARVTEMEWDCLLDKVTKLTLGNAKENEGRAAQYAAHQAQRAAQMAEQYGIAAQEEAAEKRRVFMEDEPFPPYDIGDLWITPEKDMMVCRIPRYSGESFLETDWELATKYTDTGLLWQGMYPSVAALIAEHGTPQNGWAYRNSTDKRSYFYQNGSWNIISEDGTKGTATVSLTLYKRSSIAPSGVSGNLTYTFSTGTLTPLSNLNGWEFGLPVSDGNPCYAIQKTIISEVDQVDISVSDWGDPVLIVQDGDISEISKIFRQENPPTSDQKAKATDIWIKPSTGETFQAVNTSAVAFFYDPDTGELSYECSEDLDLNIDDYGYLTGDNITVSIDDDGKVQDVVEWVLVRDQVLINRANEAYSKAEGAQSAANDAQADANAAQEMANSAAAAASSITKQVEPVMNSIQIEEDGLYIYPAYKDADGNKIIDKTGFFNKIDNGSYNIQNANEDHPRVSIRARKWIYGNQVWFITANGKDTARRAVTPEDYN